MSPTDALSGPGAERLSGLALYALTLACELPGVLARAYIGFFAFWLLAAISGLSLTLRTTVAFTCGLAPIAWSVSALVCPAGGAWGWRLASGARAPSRRERQAYAAALAQLQASAAALAQPQAGVSQRQAGAPRLLPEPRLLVLDDPLPGAWACGDALMLTRALLGHPALAAVLAHELGHITTLDARLALAVGRLTRWRRPLPRPDHGGRGLGIGIRARLWWLLRGGLGALLLRALWASWWRRREHAADTHAARLGQALELAALLEGELLGEDHAVPFLWLSAHPYPYAELRIERLLEYAVEREEWADEAGRM